MGQKILRGESGFVRDKMETMESLDQMTKAERSLLLFLETCAVDQGGLIDTRHMNAEDMELARNWNTDKFIYFGRVAFHDAEKLSIGGRTYSHWCELTPKAFDMAHAERTARANRLLTKRNWIRTNE